MELLGSINKALNILEKLKTISKKINEAEIKSVIADLSLELAEAKIVAADMKLEIVKLKEENEMLKAVKNNSIKPKLKWGCYYFDDDEEERLYCPNCYDKEGQKLLTTRSGTKGRVCNNCKGLWT